MASAYSTNLRVYNAEQFKKSLGSVDSGSLYITIGRTSPWSNESSPPIATTSVAHQYDIWKNMIAAKRIVGNDVRHVIPRYNWTSGTVYSAYTDCDCSQDVFSPTNIFYMVTDQWKVYKCLSNNNGSASTVKPEATPADSTITTTDGYVWKFMYRITEEEILRFVTNSYIPVKKIESVELGSLQYQVQSAASQGEINAILVTAPGAGYSNSTVSVTISGDGVGATAIATVNPLTQGVSKITIVDPGSGYTTANVTIRDAASGSGATANVVISPLGGHGSDALRELGGFNIMINARLVGSESGKFNVNNDYRQITLIQNPTDVATSRVARGLTYRQTLNLILPPGPTSYIKDEFVYQGASFTSASFKATVVDFDSSNNIIKLSNTQGEFKGDVLIGVDSAAARFVERAQPKELLDYSGSLLYIDNITSVQRAEDQTEDFKIVLKF